MLESTATFSPCLRYRYTLFRRWAQGDTVAFIGLNPSTADEVDNDPTVRRCINFAKAWGYGAMYMLNLFAFRATDPKTMKAESQPVQGPWHDFHWRVWEAICDSKLIVCCWGNHGLHMHRGFWFYANYLQCCRRDVKCFGKTKLGEPRHPLYLKNDTELVKMKVPTPLARLPDPRSSRPRQLSASPPA